MKRVHKPEFQEHCWHPCVLEYIQVRPLQHSTNWVIPATDRLCHVLRENKGVVLSLVGEHENFRSFRFRSGLVLATITVDGEEYVCTAAIRTTDSLSESQVLISDSGDGVIDAVTFQYLPELMYDAERDVFLVMSVVHGTGVEPTVTGVEADTGHEALPWVASLAVVPPPIEPPAEPDIPF